MLGINPAAADWLRLQTPEHTRFRSACSNPEVAQRNRLRTILCANAQTDFGRVHGFADVKTHEDFSARVPIGGHESNVQPWLDRMRTPEDNTLTAEAIRFFEQTSGSTGKAKLIPFTNGLREEIARSVAAWMVGLSLEQPGAFGGLAYWSISPPLLKDSATVAGIRAGHLDDTSYFPPRSSQALSKWLITSQLREHETPDAFYEETLQRMLECRNLSFISVWSPTFFLKLDQHLRHKMGNDFLWNGLWPQLQVLSCWTDAQSAQWLAPVRERLGAKVTIQGKGLMATEGVTSVPYPGGDPVLAVRSHFYEFRDTQTTKISLAHELTIGASYEIILTTSGGLYRYATGDIVEVTAHLDRAPRVKFLGRTGRSVDLVGEKLSEPQVIQALAGSRGFLAPRMNPCGYLLCLENPNSASPDDRVVGRVEAALAANPYYAQARQLGQLAPLKLRKLPNGFSERLTCNWAIRRGLREGDVKLPALFQPDELDDLIQDLGPQCTL